jgi:transcriptional regulator with XRE-family HTH domain
MKSKSFGSTLRDIREDGSISLRGLAKETGLDAAYLSRVERELNPAPKAEVIQKIAQTLCNIQQLDTAECEKLKRTLLKSSEQLADHSDLIRDLKHRFADRLRDEGVEESYIIDAIKKVSLETMDKVLSDEEPLEILRDNSFSKDLIEKRQSFGEEVQMLRAQNEINYSPPVKDSASDYINKHVDKVIESKSLFKYSHSLDTKPQPKSKKSTFKAGSRAVIEVEGELTSSQEEQLRSITSLVRSILKEK